MKKTKIIALSSILSALGVTVLGIGSLIEMLDLTAAAFTSLVIVLTMIEMNTSSSIMIYLVTSTLSLIILPSKLPALIYLAFAGLYPIIKFHIEKHRIKFFDIFLKLLFLNFSLLCVLAASKFLLGLPFPDTVELTKKLVLTKKSYFIVLIAMTNFAFVLYDIALTKIITLYYLKYRKHISKFFRS